MNTQKKDSKLVFLLAFVLPVLALLLIFAVKGIYPFGDRSFLRTDMYHQYVPFHAEFAEKLQNGESLLYSWEVGAGSNFITLLAYYLCSPFNLLLFLISKVGIVEYTSYMVVLKTGLAGLTMAWYLCRKFDTRTIAAAFFSMAYGLSGYMAAYSWNIMWLDCIWLAPMVLLGLELLVEENKGLMYCITLALSILTNYYISIMLCMFLVLYFICLLIMYPSQKGTEVIGESPRRVRDYLYKCLLFAFYSLLAGGLAAVLLLPVAAALKTTASANINFPDSLSTYFNTVDMLARHMAGVETEIGLEHWPNLYSCAAVFVLAPLYIMNKNIPYKEKIVKCVLLLFMLVSFAWNIPNFIWHGFHYPNSLPCRQSFLYTIVLLAMCFEALHNLRTASVAQIVGSLWGAIAFLFLCEQTVDAPEIRFYVYYINIGLIGLYGLFLYLYKRRKMSVPNLATLAFLLVFVEMTLNMGITSITTTGRNAYLKNTENFSALSEWADAEEGNNFFRIEKAVKKTKNDGAWAGYRSASIFSSTTNAAITKIYKQLGMEGSTNAYSFTGATPFVSSLLSVKYTLATDEMDGPLTTLVQTSGEVNLYRNDHVLPLGFMIPSHAAGWALLRPVLHDRLDPGEQDHHRQEPLLVGCGERRA
ncbi:MAG: YfhO family protein, partial [Lachnospiraceae bacterium]|nr:YfhO family protein [Lachnospiraceae bacterium]